MNPFVKKVVAHSKKEDKSGKFLKNGLIEIILVKIGILLALAIYNFYLDYKEQEKIQAHFAGIHEEIVPALKTAKDRYILTDSLILKVTKSLNLLNSNTKDSMVNLKENLSPLIEVHLQNYNFQELDVLLSNGYIEKVKNKETVRLLWKMQHQLNDINTAYNQNVLRHVSLIEPFINTHLNYSEIASPEKKELLVIGGPEIDYASLHGNLELWNLLNNELGIYKTQRDRQLKLVELMQKLSENISKQLK